MNTDFPSTRDLVLIGGGHTHAIVLRKWGMNPLAGVRVTLINPGPTAPYSGMLPGFVAGHYTRDELDIDLVQLAQFADARIINGAATAIDREARLISVAGRPPVGYDICAIDIGITSQMPALPGFAANGIPAKPLGPFAANWEHFRKNTRDGQVVVLGGGVAGAELSMAMAHALARDGIKGQITLIDRSKILTALGDKARSKMMTALKEAEISVIENCAVTEITAKSVISSTHEPIQSDFTVGAAGAKAHDWQRDIGVTTKDGFLSVDQTLATSDPAIFAVGDCAHMTADPRPKAGVYAVRQAPTLFHNLRVALSGGKMQTYDPQSDYLKLISLGRKSALAERFGQAPSGPLMWRLKDRIDRKFMAQFGDLPVMTQPDLPQIHALGLQEALGDKPMCGGCGAKVGPTALRGVLSGLAMEDSDSVTLGPGDDAAIIKTGPVSQVITTDHLRSFVADPVVMTRIAAIHALGDIWAMGAQPQAATISLILPRMSSDLQKRTLTEIMTTTQTVMHEAGVAIAGGHTSLGAEMTIGFTLTGILNDKPITHAGAQVGDILILTRPIGSGTIMAAAMAGQARGADVLNALDIMQSGQGNAARILQKANAMTDVTGFGLAGHLQAICTASGVGATLNIAEIPLFDSARTLAAKGIRSSLYDDNFFDVQGFSDAAEDKLLFDPQTAGGLLAAVPHADATGILTQLTASGTQAAIIGTVTAGSGINLKH